MRFTVALECRVEGRDGSGAFWAEMYKLVAFRMRRKLGSALILKRGCGWFCLDGSAKK